MRKYKLIEKSRTKKKENILKNKGIAKYVIWKDYRYRIIKQEMHMLNNISKNNGEHK